MSKDCEVCKTTYIFSKECPQCKPMKDEVKKTIASITHLNPHPSSIRPLENVAWNCALLELLKELEL